MDLSRDVWRAAQHLRAAQRLLRGVYALDVLIHLNRAIRAVDRRLADDRPTQPALTFEAAPLDDASV